ncbi:MAG: hypothetical protein Q4G68_01525 [Planctomycetia bacterium]|nr:hypothetical protein [Planctomycetia bacterium]
MILGQTTALQYTNSELSWNGDCFYRSVWTMNQRTPPPTWQGLQYGTYPPCWVK